MLWPSTQNGDLYFIFKLIRYWFFNCLWKQFVCVCACERSRFFAATCLIVQNIRDRMRRFSCGCLKYIFVINKYVYYFTVAVLYIKWHRSRNPDKWMTQSIDMRFVGSVVTNEIIFYFHETEKAECQQSVIKINYTRFIQVEILCWSSGWLLTIHTSFLSSLFPGPWRSCIEPCSIKSQQKPIDFYFYHEQIIATTQWTSKGHRSMQKKAEQKCAQFCFYGNFRYSFCIRQKVQFVYLLCVWRKLTWINIKCMVSICVVLISIHIWMFRKMNFSKLHFIEIRLNGTKHPLVVRPYSE